MNIINVENITKSYTGRKLFAEASFYVQEHEKIGIIGINGTGKSTLLKIIAGQEEPDEGKVTKANHIVISYLSQNPDLDPDGSVIDEVMKKVKTTELDEHLKWSLESDAKSLLMNLDITDFEQKTGELSGGQRKRVALVAAVLKPCDVLILDEPTNHLDYEMVEWLEDFLRKFRGAIIMVTHDRYFLDRVVDRIFAFEAGGHLTQYEGGYTDYRDKCVSSIYNVASNGTSDTSKSKAAGQVKKAYNSHEDKIKFTYMEQKEYETIDDDIEKLENRVSELDDEIAKNATSYSKLAELTKEKEDVERQLEEKMERWEYLNDLAEKIEKQKQ